MSKLFAAQLGALSKFAYASPPSPLGCSFSDRHLGQMMNCKLDMAKMERGIERERESEGDRHTSACDESSLRCVSVLAALILPAHSPPASAP